MISVFDDRICELGESPLWHPERQELVWVDMFGKKLMTKSQAWQFDVFVSALGWIDRTRILLATENELMTFDLETSDQTHVVALEADIPTNRSNDGRADPWGGFWISTMGKKNEPNVGAIYRFYIGELRQMFSELTIPNSICFHPSAPLALFADTAKQRIDSVALDPATGWPVGARETYLDLSDQDLNPDGSVFDVKGRLWNAQWGASRVACYEDGVCVDAVEIPTSQATCPAFGGAEGKTLFVASSNYDLTDAQAGMTFAKAMPVKGIPEPRVIVD